MIVTAVFYVLYLCLAHVLEAVKTQTDTIEDCCLCSFFAIHDCAIFGLRGPCLYSTCHNKSEITFYKKNRFRTTVLLTQPRRICTLGTLRLNRQSSALQQENRQRLRSSFISEYLASDSCHHEGPSALHHPPWQSTTRSPLGTSGSDPGIA